MEVNGPAAHTYAGVGLISMFQVDLKSNNNVSCANRLGEVTKNKTAISINLDHPIWQIMDTLSCTITTILIRNVYIYLR